MAPGQTTNIWSKEHRPARAKEDEVQLSRACIRELITPKYHYDQRYIQFTSLFLFYHQNSSELYNVGPFIFSCA